SSTMNTTNSPDSISLRRPASSVQISFFLTRLKISLDTLHNIHLRSQLLDGHLLLNVSRFVILHPLPYLPSRVFSFNPFIQNTRKVTEEG
ncbi:MAG: hypothetical protein V7K33_34505, partial [Nostoc sp.]